MGYRSKAESVGFEPTVPVRGHLVSSEALSTTQPTLHKAKALAKTFWHKIALKSKLFMIEIGRPCDINLQI